jgi:hypothetical protein
LTGVAAAYLSIADFIEIVNNYQQKLFMQGHRPGQIGNRLAGFGPLFITHH